MAFGIPAIGSIPSLGNRGLTSAVAQAVGLGSAIFGLQGPSSGSQTPLVLGGITFQGFEIPEKFGPLGGEQVLAVHDFPGGVRTIQTFGAFPPETISWGGVLTGPTAGDREQALDRLRVTGKLITLKFGRWSWSGYVRAFNAEPGHQAWIPYKIMFTPLADLSGVATSPQGSTSASATLAQDQTALNSTTNPTTQVQPLPPEMEGPVTGMQTSVATGVQAGNGIPAAIPPANVAAINLSNVAVIAAASTLIAGLDATKASPALDASAYSRATANTIASVNQPIARINVINPNLFTLAQQYYGDATLWQTIANANNLGADPQPLGQFTLLIPPKPAVAP